MAAGLDPGTVRSAAAQDWPPFVLVAGLLAIGLAARDDGLFHAAGALMANAARGGRSLFAAAALLVALVTAVLNLDTAVAFCTPVLILAARRRRTDETPFLYLAVFMANGASLLLPGSNLTNLIVLGEAHRSGAQFAARMALPWLASVVAVAATVGARWWRALGHDGRAAHEAAGARIGPAFGAMIVAVVAMVVLSPPWAAAVVATAGALCSALRAHRRPGGLAATERAINLPVLGGLFAVAVDLGTLGRIWAWPHQLLTHASLVATALAGTVASVVLNNLPAASLLAARAPAHPDALLVGLDLGPNLAVTAALSAVLWLQVSPQVGAAPSARRYTSTGLVVTAVSMAAALAVFAVAG